MPGPFAEIPLLFFAAAKKSRCRPAQGQRMPTNHITRMPAQSISKPPSVADNKHPLPGILPSNQLTSTFPEEFQPARAARKKILRNTAMVTSSSYTDTRLLINNEWCDAASGKTLDVVNPATGKPIGKVAHAGKADLDRALEAAQKGFEAWRKVPANERATTMRKAAAFV